MYAQPSLPYLLVTPFIYDSVFVNVEKFPYNRLMSILGVCELLGITRYVHVDNIRNIGERTAIVLSGNGE